MIVVVGLVVVVVGGIVMVVDIGLVVVVTVEDDQGIVVVVTVVVAVKIHWLFWQLIPLEQVGNGAVAGQHCCPIAPQALTVTAADVVVAETPQVSDVAVCEITLHPLDGST